MSLNESIHNSSVDYSSSDRDILSDRDLWKLNKENYYFIILWIYIYPEEEKKSFILCLERETIFLLADDDLMVIVDIARAVPFYS